MIANVYHPDGQTSKLWSILWYYCQEKNSGLFAVESFQIMERTFTDFFISNRTKLLINLLA